MRAIFYDPYLDTLGGGERYMMTLAEYLSLKDWQVDILWNDQEIKNQIKTKFNFNFKNISFIKIPQSIAQKVQMTRNYNLSFWVSDGSLPFIFSQKNILHFQVPFHDVRGRSLINHLKLKKINNIICNSHFTKSFIDKEYGVNSFVIYPPIDIENFKPGIKENIILTVGRFSQLLQAKRQDVLVEAFKKMIDQGLFGWKLVLAGGTEVGGKECFGKLENQAKRYPIELIDNPSLENLKSLYAKSTIFWSATGFGIDEEKEPEKVEHFGMTVVEAMSAGCIPLLISKGGFLEIIKEGESGLFWESEKELREKTLMLINTANEGLKLTTGAQNRAKDFSKGRFYHEFKKYIN